MAIKRIFLILALLTSAATFQAYAQSSMTDKQVMEFIVKENDKGTSRAQIVTKLMERGVPIEQIRKIRKKYEREQEGTQLGARDITGAGNRLRQQISGKTDQQNTQALGDEQTRRELNIDESSLTERQRELLKEKRQDDYSDEISPFIPDSLAAYDNIFGADKNKRSRQVFGRNIFNQRRLSFEPEMNIATPADYRLGPGDAVYVDVWGASQKNFTATVSPEGEINLEGYGPVQVSGMTVAQANRHLRSTLGTRYAGSHVRLTVGSTKTISVNVMGEVAVPGTYTLSAFATVFHALYMAGGTNDIGTLRNIKVYRNGREISNVDIYDYILNGNLRGNVRLASGDVIIVGPYECLVNISGKVKRPMYYEMKSKESVGTLIKYAGGFTGDAYQKNLRLIRKAGGEKSVFSINEFERNGFQLADGDSVTVDSALNRFQNMVEIKGAVFRPGMYQMDGSINTVRTLIEAAGGLSEDAMTARGVMHRMKKDRTLEAKAINIKGIMDHSEPDVTLENEDVLYIPSRKELISEQKLTIMGEVTYPGDYNYADNTSLEDLILQAGGLTDAASIVKIDVARRIRENKSTVTGETVAQTFTFKLKDGFVIDGTPGFILKPYDEVYVRRSPGYVIQEHAYVEGEINFAGSYPISQKGQTLSDLVKAAGGLTSTAYAKGARLERKMTPVEKLRQQSMLKLLYSGDSININKLDLSETKYVGIDLDMALKNPKDGQWDITLKDGDKLIIPQINNTVSISGEVMYPNTIAFKPGAKLSYYINQAGGYSQEAKRSRTFIVNMNGTVSKAKSIKEIQPGCEILVPAKQKRNKMGLTEIIGLGTMVAALGTMIATLVSK